MRLVIQRVKHASVTVKGTVTGKIDEGLLVLVGIEDTDTPDDSQWLAGKLVNLRIFDDENKVMNRSVTDINGGILIVSQFTLMASTKKATDLHISEHPNMNLQSRCTNNFAKT